MPYFTVPCDFNGDKIYDLLANNDNYFVPVKETYGSLKHSKYGSGRKYFELPDVSDEKFQNYLNECNKNNLIFNYVLNLSCNSNQEFTLSGQKDILAHIEKLYSAGVKRFTIAIPSLIDLVDSIFPDIEVTVSVITGVDTVDKAEYFSSKKSVKCIYVHEALNRKPELLKKIIDVCHKNETEVGTIVNSFCLLDCPFRNYHYNFGAHATFGASYIIPEYYGSICGLMKMDNPKNIVSSPWIRPNDLEFYVNLGVDKFKISGREMHANNANMLKVVETYNSKKYEGNLVSLFMCFTSCIYADTFVINNDSNIDRYMDLILHGKTKCLTRDCEHCGQCALALKSVQTNEEALKRNKELLQSRLNEFSRKK